MTKQDKRRWKTARYLADRMLRTRSTTMSRYLLLGVYWNELTPGLIADLMNYDRQEYAKVEGENVALDRFSQWAKGGECPYTSTRAERVYFSPTRRELYRPDRPVVETTLQLARRVLARHFFVWLKRSGL